MSGDATDLGLRQEPRRFGGGRLAFFGGLQRVSAALGGRAFYRAAFLAPGRFRVRHETVITPGLAPELEAFRIVQLSDPHAGPFLGRGDLSAVVEACNALDPDLVVLTGDLITKRAEESYLLLEDLAGLRARRGSFGVFGNHDYRGRREREIAARFEAEAGLRFLLDESVRFGEGPGAVALVGLEDLEEAKQVDLQRARHAVRAGDVEVVLCHNPAGGPALAAAGCALVLSGHSHGHQIDLPLVRRLAPAHPGDRVERDGAVLLTSRGLGALGVPLRLRSPAEIVVVDLSRGGGERAR
ncbi:metallophosphoesterase [Engelhardtia mirabilis]|uniref:Putative metallophosphoesterase n=1 Tax=Engelhardtia mirabilis TaxID=2528011 RepID=A0A518BL97_9BACT|nr:putative metallophosphoesterase [Planctomycetes bacterium Pla133]QDV02064.1 putative metallophosphoesterase [Planctomycetes bacterium Pla86]